LDLQRANYADQTFVDAKSIKAGNARYSERRVINNASRSVDVPFCRDFFLSIRKSSGLSQESRLEALVLKSFNMLDRTRKIRVLYSDNFNFNLGLYRIVAHAGNKYFIFMLRVTRRNFHYADS